MPLVNNRFEAKNQVDEFIGK
ncbi:MAG: hypothetical protein ACFCUV_14895 [Rivularia sp. (in: cyanobacteria)]